MLQPLLRRPQSTLRAATAITHGARGRLQYRRNLHSMPYLVNQRTFQEHGIEGFLSPDAFNISWFNYQHYLIEKLNQLTADTADAEKDTLTLVKTYAKRREMAPLFNYASMAHNNHFFFQRLSPVEVPIPPKLANDMSESASSPESLKQDFLAAASAQFGNGFVWLVSQNPTGLLKIVCTYNAGTPYSEAYARQQPVDMNTEPAAPSTKKVGWYQHAPFSDGAGPVNVAPGGIEVTPLLCVNTWEHVWLPDYGFNKDEYLENWWNRVDWKAVEYEHRQSPGYSGRLNSRTL